jgi:hypothetical protein
MYSCRGYTATCAGSNAEMIRNVYAALAHFGLPIKAPSMHVEHRYSLNCCNNWTAFHLPHDQELRSSTVCNCHDYTSILIHPPILLHLQAFAFVRPELVDCCDLCYTVLQELVITEEGLWQELIAQHKQ